MEEWTVSGTRLEAYSGPGGDVKIPDGVTEVGRMRWNGKSDITALTIPGTLRKIPDSFCYGMHSLKCVTLEEGVEEIGMNAFHQTSLQTLRLPSSLKNIGLQAFSYTSLKEVTIPNGVEIIGWGAFHLCCRLTTVHLPSSLQYVGGEAFRRTGLKDVTIPEGVEAIDNDCFSSCENLRSLRLPATLKHLGDLDLDPNLSEVVFTSVPRLMGTMTLMTAARIVVLPSVPPESLNDLVRNLQLPKGSILEADHVSFEGLTRRARLLLFRSWDKRLRQGESFPDEIRPGILKAMRKDRVRLWRAGLLRHVFLEEGLLSLQNVRSFLESAQKEHDVELTAQLLEYQNRHFPPEEVARRDQARIRRAMAGLTLPEEMETGPSDGQL